MKQVESSDQGKSHVAHSLAVGSQPLAAGSNEVQAQDIPGDGRTALITEMCSPEDVPVPDAAAATNTAASVNADVLQIQGTSPPPSVASPTFVRFKVDDGPLSSEVPGPDAASLGPDLGPRPVIDSHLASLGKSTVWSSPGRPTAPCSSLSLPVDLATVGASPASPHSPRRSPASVFSGFFPTGAGPPLDRGAGH